MTTDPANSGADQQPGELSPPCGSGRSQSHVSTAPTIRTRLAAAVFAALASGALVWIKQHPNGGTSDFAMFWTAARMVAAGDDPYTLIEMGGPWNWGGGYLYPLPGALAILPIAWLSVPVATLVFTSLGMGVLTYLVTREGWQRWPMLCSAPAFSAVMLGQWSPWVTAAALSPAMAWAAAVKPTTGLAAFLHRPSWRFVAIAMVPPLIAMLLMPDWPLRWLYKARHDLPPDNYAIPMLAPGGFVLALAALRWRRPDARLLLAMACAPQTNLLYDQLALGLIANTRLQALAFALASYAVILIGYFAAPVGSGVSLTWYINVVTTWGYYVPLLAIVLRRPNMVDRTTT